MHRIGLVEHAAQHSDHADAPVRTGFNKYGLFTTMIAALVHDCDHPGTNNDFEVKSSSRLALLYNDNSVLENHHLALAFNVLLDEQYNVFGRWSEETRRKTRKVITDAVLSTDMACHKSLQFMLQARSANAQPFDLANFDDRMDLVRIILHTADIFNAARPQHISSRISKLICEEFRLQVAKERLQGLKVTEWMDVTDRLAECKGELGFTKFVCRSYFQALAACFPGNSQLDFVGAIDANISYWQGRITALESKSQTLSSDSDEDAEGVEGLSF